MSPSLGKSARLPSCWMLYLRCLVVTLAPSIHAASFVRKGDEILVSHTASLATVDASTGASSILQLLPASPAFTAGQQSRAVAVSRDVMNTLQTVRGGSPTFYQNLYAALQVCYCDHLNSQYPHMPSDELNAVWPAQMPPGAVVPPYVRLVHHSHPNALKDRTTGACIPSANPSPSIAAQYANGYCEVTANCYWNDVVNSTATTDRAPTYSILQSTLPTTTLPSLIDAKETMTSWAKSVAVCVAPAIVLGIVSLVTTLLFLSCRCCFNKCGGRSARPEGYSCLQRAIPIVVFAVFGAAILGLTLCALLYNTVIVDSVDQLFENLLDLVQDVVRWIQMAEVPLVHVRDSVESAVESISTQLVTSDFIENGLNGIVAHLQQFANETSGVVLPHGCTLGVDTICIACDVCTAVNSLAASATSQMEAVAANGIVQLQSTRSTIVSTLVGTKDSIKSAVNAGVDVVHGFVPLFVDANSTIRSTQATWLDQTVVRRGAILGLFAVAIAILALGTVGIVLGLTPLRCLAIELHLAYVLGFVALLFLCIVSAVFLAFSVLLGDMCQLTSIAATDWSPVFGASGGNALNACFHNESFLHALHLDDALSFADVIEIPTIDLTSMLAFDALDQFARAILSADTSTFDVNPSQIVQLLNVYTSETLLAPNFQQLSPECNPHDGEYTIATILTPWVANGEALHAHNVSSAAAYIASRYAPYRSACASTVTTTCARSAPCAYDEFVTELYTNTSTVVSISTDADAFVAKMHQSMTRLQNYTGAFKTNVTTLVASLDNVGDTLQSSLVQDVTAFKASMNCTFVATNYANLHDALCDELTPAMLMVALCLFLSGCCLIPVNVCLILLVKRLRARSLSSTEKIAC
ncbi:hypothetical protein H310_04508 [Aphanomyces invadans]|uniref:Transmembrane protein n=1 Tax=Aphanomyces invadans TaxID=157072 RepID=A0A024UD10_9STRA|nr:hypothetical protein H310_04508 [Aphanomyces invadans]ETW04154.1 hypothetical protein H310_04508 [Aphanomyces invadans]|eukprot:XP_008867110.1 hypothetical protein H310_04508 [Aphanomyces invadans]